MIQWIGFILVEVIATTPFATTRSPLMLSICVTHVTSDLRPAISTSSKGQKWRDNGSSIYHQHVAATTLVSLLKAFPQKVSPFLFSCVPYQLQVASIFSFSNCPTETSYLWRITTFFTCKFASTTNSSNYFIYFRRQTHWFLANLAIVCRPFSFSFYYDIDSPTYLLNFAWLRIQQPLSPQQSCSPATTTTITPPVDFQAIGAFFRHNFSVTNVWCVFCYSLSALCEIVY